MSRRDRSRRRDRASGGAGRIVFLALGVLTAAAIIGALGVVGWVIGIANSAPSIESLKPLNQGANSEVIAADGQRLGFISSDILRAPIPSSSIPTSMKNATVAIEDRRFYVHKGVDFEGIVRAGVKNLRSCSNECETVQGGSTLTMQLIKTLYQGGRTKDFKTKIRQAKLAEDLENLHPNIEGKRWILSKYINNVPYGTVGGQTAVGVQAAARIFFDKRATDLTLGETALLAGLPQSPSRYNPFLDPTKALERRNDVLRAMVKAHYISLATADREMAKPLGVKHSRYYSERREGYFFDYVKDQLIKKYGLNEVRRGGLRVDTTIDLKLQQVARKAIAGRLNEPGDPAAALVSMDPYTGQIKTMASSAHYADSKFNLAAQAKRQPGSTFKVIVLMALLRRNVDIKKTTYESKPLNFVDAATGTKIDVQTDDHRYTGNTSLFEGLVRSDNTVYQQADLDAGPEAVRQTAYDMGITSHLDAYPAEGLGGLRFGVSPLEMARAYASIVNGGYRVRPVSITKVTFPDGRVDTSIGRPGKVKVFTDGQTYEAIKAMEANVQRGTGTAAGLNNCPAAGKTGTTSSLKDAWFVGFTPHIVTSSWVGYPNVSKPMYSVHGIEVFGGTFPAEIWHDYMEVADKGSDCDPFPKPKVPFVAEPFFGHYATTGAPGKSYDPQTGEPLDDGTVPKGSDIPAPGKTGGTGTSTTPTKNPGAYETPPQGPPATQTPTGTGTGTGTGNLGTGTGTGNATGNTGTGAGTAAPTGTGQR